MAGSFERLNLESLSVIGCRSTDENDRGMIRNSGFVRTVLFIRKRFIHLLIKSEGSSGIQSGRASR